MSFNICLKSNNKNSVIGIGSFSDVIDGLYQPDLKGRWFNGDAFRFGFGLASPESFDSMGEMLLVNGCCFTTSTDSYSEKYLETITGEKFCSTAFFAVTHDVEPNIEYSGEGLELDFNSFVKKIYDIHREPLIYVAKVKFSHLRAEYITKCPIVGENIFDFKSEYFNQPYVSIDNTPAFIVGAVSDYNNDNIKDINDQLRSLLYKHPFDNSKCLTTHTHAITFSDEIESCMDIQPDRVDQTLHLFNDGSVIESISGYAFNIGALMES